MHNIDNVYQISEGKTHSEDTAVASDRMLLVFKVRHLDPHTQNLLSADCCTCDKLHIKDIFKVRTSHILYRHSCSEKIVRNHVMLPAVSDNKS